MIAEDGYFEFYIIHAFYSSCGVHSFVWTRDGVCGGWYPFLQGSGIEEHLSKDTRLVHPQRRCSAGEKGNHQFPYRVNEHWLFRTICFASPPRRGTKSSFCGFHRWKRRRIGKDLYSADIPTTFFERVRQRVARLWTVCSTSSPCAAKVRVFWASRVCVLSLRRGWDKPAVSAGFRTHPPKRQPRSLFWWVARYRPFQLPRRGGGSGVEGQRVNNPCRSFTGQNTIPMITNGHPWNDPRVVHWFRSQR